MGHVDKIEEEITYSRLQLVNQRYIILIGEVSIITKQMDMML